jgi:hypothetical protein
MYRLFVLAGVLAVAVVVSGVQGQDKDTKKEKPKDIGEIMKKAHAGDEALRTAITSALKAKDFEKAAPPSRAWAALASHLGTFDPPRGSKTSWEKLTKRYGDQVKTLAKAIEDKNAKAATAELKKINTSCGACHTPHRKKKN